MSMILSKAWNMTPFEVLKQDIDDFILLANYLSKLGSKSKNENNNPAKVNDGFWDM